MTPVPSRSLLLVAALLCWAALPMATASQAATRAELDESVRQSGEVFRQMRTARDREIPEDLLRRSRCVAVVPNVIKAAWLVGGRYGTGVLSCRLRNGEWSPPVFVMLTGGSFGFQAGASSTDVVLFFMNYNGVRSVLNNKVKLSGEAGLAAGPVGREAEAATDGQFRAQIYSYARSRGLFAGVSVAGAYIGVDVEDTQGYYGRAYSTDSILFEGRVARVPKSTWSFLGALPGPPAAARKKPPAASRPPARAATAPPPHRAPVRPAPPRPAPPPAADTAKTAPPSLDAPGSDAFGEASGTAAAAGEASGTAAAAGEASGTVAAGQTWGVGAPGEELPLDNVLGGEASGTANDGNEASGTAAALPPSGVPAGGASTTR